MEQFNITGVAIVNEANVLVGQITAKCLNEILSSRDYSILHSPISSFLTGLSVEAGKSISTTIDTSLSEAIHRFASTRSHRLFLVDAQGHVEGVCSLKDLLGSLILVNGQVVSNVQLKS
jgi:CBS-domain-containing membrane protein